jgi:hypothetical protein
MDVRLAIAEVGAALTEATSGASGERDVDRPDPVLLVSTLDGLAVPRP